MIYLNSFGILFKDATKENSLCQNKVIVCCQCEISFCNGTKGVYERKTFFSTKESQLLWIMVVKSIAWAKPCRFNICIGLKGQDEVCPVDYVSWKERSFQKNMIGLEQGNVILTSGNVSANLFLRYQPVSSSSCSSGLVTEWIQTLN